MLCMVWHSMGTLVSALFFHAVHLDFCRGVCPGLLCSEAVAEAAAVEVAAALVAAAGSVAGVAVLEVALVATEGIVADVSATAVDPI